MKATLVFYIHSILGRKAFMDYQPIPAPDSEEFEKRMDIAYEKHASPENHKRKNQKTD